VLGGNLAYEGRKQREGNENSNPHLIGGYWLVEDTFNNSKGEKILSD